MWWRRTLCCFHNSLCIYVFVFVVRTKKSKAPDSAAETFSAHLWRFWVRKKHYKGLPHEKWMNHRWGYVTYFFFSLLSFFFLHHVTMILKHSKLTARWTRRWWWANREKIKLKRPKKTKATCTSFFFKCIKCIRRDEPEFKVLPDTRP